ncbi:MAG: tetratricopeptide repeat protein [Phycisphaeraceae bacterium]|nr:tetratricopeptide repeat protein [Phycisphaeraceae bacterium]
MSSRLEQLMGFYEKDPTDVFSLYGIAMEHLGSGDEEQALAWFQKVHAEDPDHAYAHYHRARALSNLGRNTEAAEAIQQGLEAARRSGDSHAAEELTALAESLR